VTKDQIAGSGLPPCVIILKSLLYLAYSEINRESFENRAWTAQHGPADSRGCGGIPCAAEQGSEFTATGNQFPQISECTELEQGLSEFGAGGRRETGSEKCVVSSRGGDECCV